MAGLGDGENVADPFEVAGMSSVAITELTEPDLPFLLDLWHQRDVMRYADEMPGIRGWGRTDTAATAWRAYEQRRTTPGRLYAQYIVRLADGTPIGESFSVSLPEGATFGTWRKPKNIATLLGDIKLAPPYWGQGLATQAMRLVVAERFAHTPCELYCVPPHVHNPAARRVYQKVGFVPFEGMHAHNDHRAMELTKERFEALRRNH